MRSHRSHDVTAIVFILRWACIYFSLIYILCERWFTVRSQQGVIVHKIYVLSTSIDTSSTERKQLLMMTSLSEQRHIRFEENNGLPTRIEITPSILIPLPWNLLINSSIHVHICNIFAQGIGFDSVTVTISKYFVPLHYLLDR